jgi:hypothetical protein
MKKIIVIGAGWSGSGAVLDYLSGREDIASPFGEREFRIVGDPNGIFCLNNILKYSFSIHNADHGIKELKKLLLNYNKSIRYSKDIFPRNDTKEFLKNIIQIKYKGASGYQIKQYPRLIKSLFNYLRKITNKKGRRANFFNLYYPVSLEEFQSEAEIFINKVINANLPDNVNYKYCVINHGGTFWNPESSTIFYGDRRIILVTRDPRDVFVEMKRAGNAYPAENVEIFSNWYKSMMQKINITEWKSEKVLHIKFEEFVNNFKNEKSKIDNFLGLNENISSTYNFEKSKKNIGKYKLNLTNEEINTLNRKLSNYI